MECHNSDGLCGGDKVRGGKCRGEWLRKDGKCYHHSICFSESGEEGANEPNEYDESSDFINNESDNMSNESSDDSDDSDDSDESEVEVAAPVIILISDDDSVFEDVETVRQDINPSQSRNPVRRRRIITDSSDDSSDAPIRRPIKTISKKSTIRTSKNRIKADVERQLRSLFNRHQASKQQIIQYITDFIND